jgi:hypothetical protein
VRVHQWMPAKASRWAVLSFRLVVAGGLVFLLYEAHRSPIAAQTPSKLEATIFSYDGKDFVRTKTTMMTKEGKPAVNTKPEHDNPAYTALTQKHSFTGDVTVFGRKYDANYAPLTSADGRLTGALFVAEPE